jgi:YndJ-like protein
MKTIVERRSEKQIPPFGRNEKRDLRNDKLDLLNDTRNLWAPVCATAGAAAWAGIAVLARMGIVRLGAIELLFLFAPLVIVPLGMELGRVLGGAGRFEELARRLQPLGAALAVVAMWLPPGKRAGLAALGWMVICVLMAGSGFVELVRALWTDAGKSARATRVVMAIARIDLVVGGAWLVASRLGMRPMGIQEPIGLLTAVHFHFAGFATATIAAATLRFAEREHSWEHRWLKPVVLMVAGLPIVVAAGFVISPIMKMIAAILFSASVAGLAIAVRACGRRVKDPTARILLQVAAGAVFAGMVLAGVYAVTDYLGSDALTIPQMARTHGILNALGFCLSGLLGWLVETSGRPESQLSGANESPHPSTSLRAGFLAKTARNGAPRQYPQP